VRIAARVEDAALRGAVVEAARELSAEVTWLEAGEIAEDQAITRADVVLVEMADTAGAEAEPLRDAARRAGAALVIACPISGACPPEFAALTDEWILLPAAPEELVLRIAAAHRRAVISGRRARAAQTAELVRYEELLFDRRTGFPTLPVMIERAREILNQRGELTIVYIHFVWYEKIEEIYGWQKLDDVLETTAEAIREFYQREHPDRESLMMVSHVADDDFILFTQIPSDAVMAEQRLRQLSSELRPHLYAQIEATHGEEIAALCGIYIGAAAVFRNPKIRTERLVYRGLREAAQAARGAEEWERSGKVADLKALLREGAVFIEYHPIIVTRNQDVYGYEALARGKRRELRSPDVLFEVAEEGNLLWELSRLLRRRAIEGMKGELEPGQYLFLNVDPHDFDDPLFRNMDPRELGIDDPGRIVLEITERTAIKDYPRFQEYLAAFRERGFRFAVDDAGSGYAGLGSIANLAPDYIKLDISLISNIDTNFLKQNLVETMVGFAESQGAKVIAEGVERQEEFDTVRDLGVHLTQGFLFHKPSTRGA